MKKGVLKEVWLYGDGSVSTKDEHGRKRRLRSVECLPKALQVKISVLDAAEEEAPENIQHAVRGYSSIPDYGSMDSFPDDVRLYSFKKRDKDDS